MPFQIIRNNITKVKADAIVNTANPKPWIGHGTDSAIYHAAGAGEMLAQRLKIGDIAPGQAAYTDAFRLHAKYVIHTVGPKWIDGAHGERELLRSCYENSLRLAATLSCESVAFPLIATGVYGFPKDEALQIALDEIRHFLSEHEMQVILVVFDPDSYELSRGLVAEIDAYIDERTAAEQLRWEYAACAAPMDRQERDKRERPAAAPRQSVSKKEPEEEEVDRVSAFDRAKGEESAEPSLDAIAPDEAAVTPLSRKVSASEKITKPSRRELCGKSLEEVLGNVGDTFQQRLFQLIDESGMDDVTVYTNANIDRRLFSKIRSRVDYRPKKKTAVALAIALELDMPTTQDLLSRAEIAFSPSNEFDLIISYFITNRVYDIFEINAALFDYGQPLLGA